MRDGTPQQKCPPKRHFTGETLRFHQFVREKGLPPEKTQLRGNQKNTIHVRGRRTYFLIDIPRNPDCLGVPIVKDDMKDDMKELPDIQKIILSSISSNDKITVPELTRKAGGS